MQMSLCWSKFPQLNGYCRVATRVTIVSQRCYSGSTQLDSRKAESSVFSTRSTIQLLRHLAVLRLSPSLSNVTEDSYYTWCNTIGQSMVNWAFKKSFFGHYCAGVTEYDPMAVATELKKCNIGSIFALCAEGEPTDLTQPPEDDLKDISTYNIIKERTLGTVNLAGTTASMTEKSEEWEQGLASVKLSGLAPMSVLERLSEIFVLYQQEHEGAYPSSLSDYFEYATTNNSTRLSDYELAHAQRFADRVDRICYRGSDMSVRVIIEAEWSAIQPFFNFLAVEMMKKYNIASNKVPTVYKTYQTYLRESEGKVDLDLQLSVEKGFRLGCVITNGDYHTIEKDRAAATGQSSPVNGNADDTDSAFERITRTLLLHENSPHLIIASHKDSLVESVIKILEEDCPQNRASHVSFAQLFGVGDVLTYNIAERGYKVCKYLPYGRVSEAVPHIIRRIQESSTHRGSTAQTVEAIIGELKARWSPSRVETNKHD